MSPKVICALNSLLWTLVIAVAVYSYAGPFDSAVGGVGTNTAGCKGLCKGDQAGPDIAECYDSSFAPCSRTFCALNEFMYASCPVGTALPDQPQCYVHVSTNPESWWRKLSQRTPTGGCNSNITYTYTFPQCTFYLGGPNPGVQTPCHIASCTGEDNFQIIYSGRIECGKAKGAHELSKLD